MQILAIAGLWLCLCALQPIPNQGAHTREDLFSMAVELQAFQGLRILTAQPS